MIDDVEEMSLLTEIARSHRECKAIRKELMVALVTLEQVQHVAYNALAELERNGVADFLLIKDATVQGYWEREKKRDE